MGSHAVVRSNTERCCHSTGCGDNYHRLGGLTNRHLFLSVLEAGCPRSRCRQVWSLLKAHVLPREPSSWPPMAFPWSSYLFLSLQRHWSHHDGDSALLTTPKPGFLPIPTSTHYHFGVRVLCLDSGGTQTLSP